MEIGILGLGYVGKALKAGFEAKFKNVYCYDKYQTKLNNVDSLISLVSYSEIIFICLPTPMDENGKCDSSLIDDELSKINSIASDINTLKTVVIKSTVIPGTTTMMNNKNEHLNIIFNPEFLTERNFLNDFKNQDRIILGSDSGDIEIVKKIYREIFPDVPIIQTNCTTAEMIKYVTNTFLATKVSFANQIKMICDSLNLEYDDVIKFSAYDKRLGDSHWEVPGPDGNKGFGGSCFPKDLRALTFLSKELGVDSDFLEFIWNFNIKIRGKKDWELLKGRAVKG